MNIDSAKKEVKAFKRIDERYNEVYKRCIELCPDMRNLVEQISHINPPRANEYKELYLRKQNGDSKATNRMIEMYLRTALRFSLDAAEKTSLPLDEIFSEAVIGLAEYVQRYDLQKNRLFSSYIISGIHQGINAYIRQNSSYIPLPAQFAQTVEIVKAEKEKYSSDSYYYMSKKISEVTGLKLKEVELALYYTEPPISYEDYCKHRHCL